MFKHPRIKATLTRASVDGDKLFLFDEGRQTLLEDRAAASLAPLLDGTRPLDELLGELDGVPFPEVLAALAKLERLGHLVEGPGTGDAHADAWWDAQGVAPTLAAGRIAEAQVSLTVLGDAPAAAVADAFARAGLALDDGGLQVVLVDDYLDRELAEINRRRLADGRPWLLARLTGLRLWLGPHFRPGETACWACLAERLSGNRQLERYLAGRDGAARVLPGAAAMLASTAEVGAGLLTTEVLSILATGSSPRLDHRLVTVELPSLDVQQHAVVQLPTCAACGDPDLLRKRPVEIVLQPRPKRFTADGGHRVQPPQETLHRLARHISPLTGAVTTVASQTVVDNGVAYSYSSGHNFALMQDSVYFLRKNLRGRSGGKGRTDAQARAGAVCEAIERFNGIFRGDEPVLNAPYAEVAERAVHPAELLIFSDRQYDERDTWNPAQLNGYHIVPKRLDPERPIDWSPAWSLTHERERLVPTAYAYFGHPDVSSDFYCASDANGNAAGNTLEEAILQGLMELVERDSVALWWYNRARRPAFDLDSLDEPYIDLMREYYASLGREFWVLDITSDLGIPAFAAVSNRIDRTVEDIVLGFGAHVDPRMAAMRSLTELNQFLPAVTDTNPDGTTNYWMDDHDAVEWWTTATLANQPYVVPDESLGVRTAADFDPIATDDISEDVRRCVERLGSLGHEVIVLDQSRPEIELAVCKVMAPGLRHFWRRIGPGRLYETPPQLGWLDTPSREEELNPVGIFF
ncbi:MAG TPA: TOMM precursor leader peptide-binding protein [Gaiellaceae bacterium]